MRKNILSIIISVTFVIIDQTSKYLTIKFIQFDENITLFKGLFLTPLYKTVIIYENNIYLILVNFLLPITVFVIMSISLIKSDNYLKIQRLTLWILLGGVLSGIIDRIFRNGRILEIIQFKIYTFSYVFNIAELYIVICGLIVILSLIIKDRSIL